MVKGSRDDVGADGRPRLPRDQEMYLATRPPGLEYQMGGCGIAGCIAFHGKTITGEGIGRMLSTMGERENGLGAGYACYGLFPDHRDDYCLQFFFDDEAAKQKVEELLAEHTSISKEEKVYTRPVKSLRPPYPLIWRYFLQPRTDVPWNGTKGLPEDDYIINLAMHVNSDIDGAMCISSGKDMAVFKGNGFSYEIADFYDIGRYRGNMWISHSRFPTNSPAWWAGAHPLSILDWGVCHNGEITSYGVNRKLVEMAGYKCTVLTDTEVVAYMWDMLVRKHGLPIADAAFAMAPWTYEEINTLDEQSRKLATWTRIAYKEAFLNGPFSILVGRSRPDITLIALADRKKLRPMLVGRSPDEETIYCASEECAIRVVEPDAYTWTPNAGSPLVATVKDGLVRDGTEHPFKGGRA
jgi:glutamate synthase domain-containing protein 1